MKKLIACLSFLLITFSYSSFAQYAPITYTVRITATVKDSAPSIKLKWHSDTAATSFSVYKKQKSDLNWKHISTLTGNDTTYTDTTVIADSAYEYRVTRGGSSEIADGYIYAGVKLHATDYRGKMLLIVDSTFVDSLASEVTRLMSDISADGWAVSVHYVSRNASAPWVKSYIRDQYMADSQNVKGLFLLGHVPVPFSGSINPDGHPEHLGAWPADVYYGDIHGTYTDLYAYDTASNIGYPINRNVPGDGKFDQSIIPGQVLLQIGRVDLSDMTEFPKTEKQLLQQYLQRDHDYRFKNFTMLQRGLISDNFGTYGEGFASCGWRNFAPMFGDTGIHTGDYISTLKAQNYLWSYGCGGGNNEGAGGIGSTTDFVNDSVRTVFTMMFGSWFGDWDHPNNFLRAQLASPGLALTCTWAGRPFWFFHHMVMGETIGYSTLITQNTTYYHPYYPSYGAKFIHIALMGDPTLRQHTITPPQNVTAAVPTNGFGISLSWDNSPDSVAGYYVYRSKEKFGKYDRVSTAILKTPPFVDNPPASGLYYYYVKAAKWEHTPSGNYLNTSEGAGAQANEIISGIAEQNPAKNGFIVYPNPAADNAFIVWQNAPVGEYDITVRDELGRSVFTTKASVTSAYSSLPISLKGFSAGCYFVEASGSTSHFVQKMVVGK